MTKRLIKFFNKSLTKKKLRKLRSSDKRNIPDKLKQMYNSETRSKDQAQTKISSDHKQNQNIIEQNNFVSKVLDLFTTTKIVFRHVGMRHWRMGGDDDSNSARTNNVNSEV